MRSRWSVDPLPSPAWIDVGLTLLLIPALVFCSLLPVVFILKALASGGARLARRRRRRIGRRERPEAPWTWDQAWEPQGESRASRWAGARWFMVGLALLTIGGLLSYAIAPYTAALAVFFALLALYGLVPAWGGVRQFSRGAVVLSYARFPFFVGERVEMSLGVSDGGASFESATIVLRRIEEFPGRTPLVWCTLHRKFDAPAELLPGPGHDLALAFDVPPDASGTDFDGERRCCYELLVHGRTDRGEVRETFVVPIYDRPTQPAA